MKKILFFAILLSFESSYSQEFYLKIKDHYRIDLKQKINVEPQINYDFGLETLNRSLSKVTVVSFKKAFNLPSPKLERTYKLKVVHTSVEEIKKLLEHVKEVDYVEEVPRDSLFYIPNDMSASLWHLNKINASQAWDISKGSSSVRVAVVDDGVLTTHEDLASKIWTNPNEIANNGIDDDHNGYIDDIHGYDVANNDNNPSPPMGVGQDHGTHVSGIACGATNNGLGMASIGINTMIIPVKSTYDNITGVITNAYDGVAYAIAIRADVVNMSWGGGGYSITAQNLFNYGHSLGIIFVAAAGNSSTSSPMYPSAYNHVISVAASNQTDQLAYFSNYGSTIDVTAPGVSIYSSVADNNSSYSNFDGTSMASPLVAGLCALMKSHNPLPPDSIEACLKRSCDNINAQNPTMIGKLGAGRINAYQSLQCLQKNPIADFKVNYSQNCVNQPIQYISNSFGASPLSYSWSFPGGTPSTSTSANPIVTYSTTGTKSATLIVSNALGNDSKTINNVVNIQSPTATLSGNLTVLNGTTAYLTINFTGNPPYRVTLFDGQNTITKSGIKDNPYLFPVMPSKDTTIYSVLNYNDSMCLGTSTGNGRVIKKSTNGATSCDTSTLQNGLLLNLPFNGNTQDVSGNGNHAINYGATPAVGKNGVANTAYRFNGVNSYMKVLNSNTLSPKNISMCAIIKPRGFYSGLCMNNQIMAKNNIHNLGHYSMVYAPLNNNGSCQLQDTNQCNFYAGITTGGCSVGTVYNSPFIMKDTWYCLVATYDEDTLKMYINGVYRFSCKVNAPMGSNMYDLFIGKLDNPSYPFWLNADIDDIRLYNRALSASEVNAYCGTCSSSPVVSCDTSMLQNGLLLNLPFNGNTQDVSGNGNHAINYGATPTVGKNGVANTAYQFNGSSYMKILNSTSLNPSNDITITAVVRVNTFNGDNCNGNQIIKKGNNDFQFGEYAIGFSPNAYTGGCLGNDPNHQNYVGYLYDNRPTSSMVNNAPYIKTQEWDCIVFTKDSDSCKTYVNGVVRQSFSSKLYGSNSDDVYIGKMNHPTYPFWFNGTIDDIRLYNRALSAGEVNAYCGTCSNVVIPCQKNAAQHIVKCIRDTVTLLSKKGTGYVWSPSVGLSSSSIQNPKCYIIKDQTYFISYLDSLGCQLIDTIYVKVNSPSNYIPLKDQRICKGDSIQIQISNAAMDISWSPNINISGTTIYNPYLYPIKSSDYFVSYRDSLGCIISDTMFIQVDDCCSARAKFTANKTKICIPDSILFTSQSKYKGKTVFTWNFDNGATPNVFNGENPPYVKYSSGGEKKITLIVKDSCGTDSFSFYLPAYKTSINAGRDTSYCIDRYYFIGSSPISSYTYLWSPASYLDNPNKANPKFSTTVLGDYKYVLTVKDNESGCEAIDTINIKSKVCCTTKAVLSFPKRTYCVYDTIEANNYTVQKAQHQSRWRISGDTDLVYNGYHLPRVNIEKAGLYALTLAISDTCSEDSFSYTFRVVKVNVDAGIDTTVCQEESYKMGTSVYSSNYLFIWSPNLYLNNNKISNPYFKGKENMQYILKAEDLISKCIAYDTVNIRLYGGDSCFCELLLPSAFSPNGDGLNDYWRPVVKCPLRTFPFSYTIFSKWGQKIFSGNESSIWDGTFNGEKVPIGVYVYRVFYTHPSRQVFEERTGNITIVE